MLTYANYILTYGKSVKSKFICFGNGSLPSKPIWVDIVRLSKKMMSGFGSQTLHAP